MLAKNKGVGGQLFQVARRVKPPFSAPSFHMDRVCKLPIRPRMFQSAFGNTLSFYIG